jgi:hypothetical protein
MKNLKFKTILVMSFTLAILLTLYPMLHSKDEPITNEDPYLRGVDTAQITKEIPSIQMYYYIKKYSNIYQVPESYAFSIAYVETRYKGPLDSSYNHKLTSYAGACGPMQIMPSTAKLVAGKPISRKILTSDIQLNVELSMKLCRILHDKYKNWGLVFGAYNTGRPCINRYAKAVLNNKYIWES